MYSPPPTEMPADQPAKDVNRQRDCLRCGDSFESEWAGVRICPRCKRSKAWQSGVSIGSGSTGRRR
jgi:hypothetical protein